MRTKKRNKKFTVFFIITLVLFLGITATNLTFADPENTPVISETETVEKNDTQINNPSIAIYDGSKEPEVINRTNQGVKAPRWNDSEFPMTWKWVSSGTDAYNWGYGNVTWDYYNGAYTYDWLKITSSGVEGNYRLFDVYVATTATSNYHGIMGSPSIWKFHNVITLNGTQVADVSPTYPNGIKPTTGGDVNAIPSWGWTKATTVKLAMGQSHKIERITYNTDTNTRSYLTANINLPITKFTVDFVDHDSTLLKKQVVDKGTNATAPSSPSRDGYTFNGWDKDFTNIQSNLTVTAQYKINQYIVYFDGNGGTSSFNSITKNYQEQLGTLPTATRKGFTFKGWWTSASGGSKISSSTTMPLNGTTYYAHWERNKYTISTSVENGSITATDQVLFESNKIINFSPKDGYVLDKIIVDGKELNISNYKDTDQYTFSNVEANHTIHVKYKQAAPIKINIQKEIIDKDNNVLSSTQIERDYGITKNMMRSQISIKLNAKNTKGFLYHGESLIFKDIQKGTYPIIDIPMNKSFTFVGMTQLRADNNVTLNKNGNSYIINVVGDSRTPREIKIKSTMKIDVSVMGDQVEKENFIFLQ